MSRLAASSLVDLDISWDDLIARAPTFGLFCSAYFSDPARTARESLVVHRDGEPLFLLPLGRYGDQWVSHPETFAAGLIPLIGAAAEDVHGAVAAVATSRSDEVLLLRLRPTVVDPDFAEWESGAWRLQPTTVARSTAVLAIDLAEPPATSSRRRRALSKATRNGMVVRPVRDYADLRVAWGCITDVYSRRGLSDLMPVDRVQALLSLGDVASVHVVEVGDRVVGAALGYRLGQAYRLPLYGMLDDPEAAGGTESVIKHAGEAALENGCRFLDLGTSTDPRSGRTISGIVEFKVEMGGRPFAVEHLRVELPRR